MSSFISARKLTGAEQIFLRQGENGKSVECLKSIAIMAKGNHPYIQALDVVLTTYRIHLGAGQYIDEVRGGGLAPDSKKISIVWSSDTPFGYLEIETGHLGISFVRRKHHPNVIYFESKNIDIFLEAFSYIDHALMNWYCSRPLLSRMFGAIGPEYKSREVEIITKRVREILAAA